MQTVTKNPMVLGFFPSSGPSCTGDAYFWHDPNDLNSVNNELNVFQSFRAYYNSNYSQYFVNMASSPPFDMLGN
ncbi:MAG: hypothetical protein IPJ45_17475 [Ignavibacteria bacterium]|nr:hypothetical protein [Ignavibacteria bacterium]